MVARLWSTLLVLVALASMGASARTPNFIVSAPTQAFAEQVAQHSETLRRELAIQWLGSEMPRWSQPCPVRVDVGPELGAGGATTFVFDRGEVFGWNMSVQGSPERILDSVLPHEITHTVFASHFRQPLPRWADEGACTTVEHISERSKQDKLLIQFLKTGRGISFSRMFAMKDYPPDILPLYSQGYSLARFLIGQSDRKRFLAFVADGLKTERWNETLEKHYGFQDVDQLQATWLSWVQQGSPRPTPQATPEAEATVVLASNERRPRPEPNLLMRKQDASPTRDLSDESKWAARGSDRRLPAEMPQAEEAVAMVSPTRTQVTRPQPPEQARQVILEWNSPGPADPWRGNAAAGLPGP